MKKFESNLNNYLWWFGVTLVFLTQIIWHMPGTIALRNVLLGLLALLTITLVYRNSAGLFNRAVLPKAPLSLLLILTAWITLVNIVWGTKPQLNWSEFASHWLVPVVCFFVAWMFGSLSSAKKNRGASILLQVVFWSYLVQVVAHDVMSGIFYAETGAIPFRQAPVLYLPDMIEKIFVYSSFPEGFSGRFFGFFSYVNAIMAAILTAEIMQRFLAKRRSILVSNLILILGLIAVLICSYTLRGRNGNIGLLVLLFFSAIMVTYRLAANVNKTRLILGFAGFLVAVSATGYAFIKSDPRWQTLAETVPIAWDTQTHKAWLYGGPYPLLSDGQEADGSNYERVAWVKEGWVLLLERPLGSGYDRNAWGGRLDDKYNMGGATRGGHSHNGVLDFAIATGFPGVLLWLGFIASLGVAGFRGFKAGNMTAGLLLIFIVTGYLGRSLVDSVIRDHFLQVFMFLSGLLLALSQGPMEQDSDAKQANC